MESRLAGVILFFAGTLGRAGARGGFVNTQDIIKSLSGLGPGTDKPTLIKAVDDAVNGIVVALDTSEAGKVPTDVMQATKVTLGFLEACQEMGDAEFSQHTKVRAAELLTAFGKKKDAGASAGGASAGSEGGAKPPRKKRRPRRPTKDGAAAKKAAAKKPVKKGAKKPPSKKGAAFEESEFTRTFTDAFCKFLRTRAMLWYVPQHDLTPTPFPLSSTFGDNLVTAVKEHFVQRFFTNRRIVVMEDDMKLAGYAEETYMESFLQPKKTNPTRLVWDDGLKEISRLLTEGSTDKKVEAKTKTKKSGGLFGFFQKEEKVVDRKVEIDDTELKRAQAFWNTLAGPDVKYDPPRLEDIHFLSCLFEFHPEDIESSQQATQQMLRQEFGSSETREGAARDHLNELIRNSAEYAGELTALWAYLMNRKEFGYGVFKSFTSSHGTSPQQREKSLPIFLRWLPDFTELDKPKEF